MIPLFWTGSGVRSVLSDSTSHPNYFSDPDVILMLAVKKGEQAPFETLMHKYYKRVFNFIYRFVSDRETAEDLTQETFLRVYRAARTYAPQAKFQTWLLTIARNLSLNDLRRRKVKMVSLQEEILTTRGQVPRQVEDKGRGPHEQLLAEERQEFVRRAISALPVHQRAAVSLRRYDDLSYEEISQVLGCSVAAVKSLLNRAKENLRQQLESVLYKQENEENFS